MSLKALALLALERNRARNSGATTPAPTRNSGATPDPQEIAAAEYVGALLEALEYLTTDSQISARSAFEALTPDDRDGWGRGEVTQDHLQAFVSTLETAAMRRNGDRPPHYSRAAECARCGPVWLWETVSVQTCPWCINRLADLPIPRPATVACRQSRHYTQDTINPTGGLGHCERRQQHTWPGGDCPQFETIEAAARRIGDLSKALGKAQPEQDESGKFTGLPAAGKNGKAAALKAAGLSTSKANR